MRMRMARTRDNDHDNNDDNDDKDDDKNNTVDYKKLVKAMAWEEDAC
jgi:hypothetical protein